VQARAADSTGGDGDGTTFQSPTAAAPDPIHHYLQFLNAEAGFRYVYQDLNAGQVVERDLSYRLTTTMKLNLTSSGATYVQMRSENGPGFNSGFQSTGLGSPGSFSMNVKSLFVGQRFGSHVEAQAGGIEFDRGSGTDATYAAGEGWLTGYRLMVNKLRSSWGPDRFGVTVGFVGDFTKPNFFSRSERLGDANYVQALADKRITERLDASAEMDRLSGFQFTREAVNFSGQRSRILDKATLECVGRVSNGASFGWATAFSNTLDSKDRWHPGFIYSQIPDQLFLDNRTRQQALLNAGDFGLGKHAAATLRVTPVRNLEIGLLASHRLGTDPTGHRWRGNIHVSYQFAGLLNHLAR